MHAVGVARCGSPALPHRLQAPAPWPFDPTCFPAAGNSTVQQAFEAQKALLESQAEQRQLRQHFSTLLTAHGLPVWRCDQEPSIQSYLLGETDLTDEQLLAAARRQNQAQQELDQKRRKEIDLSIRKSTMGMLLSDAGLHSFYACELTMAARWLQGGPKVCTSLMA